MKYHWNIENMERLSILIDKRHLDLQEVVYNREKPQNSYVKTVE